MPVHDWTKVDAGTFHSFHSTWIAHLMESLNSGVLPPDYYALSEQRFAGVVPDVLTLQRPDRDSASVPQGGGLALAEAPPKVGRRLIGDPDAVYRNRRRTLTIRHRTGHRIVAFLEILSPGNKDRSTSLQEFVNKVDDALRQGIHVLIVDLFPPGRFDPHGVHGAIWAGHGDEEQVIPNGSPLTLCSYRAVTPVEAYLEYIGFGEPLPEMPLFLDAGTYVDVPLEPTYQAAFRGMPAFLRDELDGALPAR